MKFFIKLALSFVSLWLIWYCFILAILDVPYDVTTWMGEQLRAKTEISDKISGNKIVLVGGSNVLFGFDSNLLHEEWGIPVVNHGLHAGNGIHYIFTKAKDFLKPNDIAIVSLEYSHYLYDGLPRETLLDYAIAEDTDYFKGLDIKHKFDIIARVKFERVYKALERKIKGIPAIQPKGHYSVEYNNEYGDQDNLNELVNDKTRDKIKGLAPGAVPTITKHFEKDLNDFVEWTEQNNVCVIFMPPDYLHFAQYDKEPYLSAFKSIPEYFHNRNLVFLGDPFEYMFPREHMYDTAYHLNDDGMKIRTELVIKDIGPDIYSHCGSTQE